MTKQNQSSHLNALRRMREAYQQVIEALPWFDMSVWEQDPPAFSRYAHEPTIPAAHSLTAELSLVGKLADLKTEREALLLRFDPQRSGPLEALTPLIGEMAQQRVPLVVLHTDVEMERIGDLAAQWAQLPIVVESGPLKILYHLAGLEKLLTAHPNTFLCTYNFCNWLGLERLCKGGFGKKLLFGTHSPRYNPHAAMGPIALAQLSWAEKCNMAGNNLRRLLGLPEINTQEYRLAPLDLFIVDAHTHNGSPDRFPVPDQEFTPRDWLDFMDFCGIERICLCPYEAIVNVEKSARELAEVFVKSAPGRFSYLEVFHPGQSSEHCQRLERALSEPGCVGIKIHPSLHEVEADDEAYAPAYEIAARHGVPLLTHSWDVSATNPVQYMSHPARFRRHLRNHPNVQLVLGHAGGRPGAMEAVVKLCREFPRVMVDLAGDYYDIGMIEHLVDHAGADRVIFASDMNWIDPRCNLGPVLAAQLPDETLLQILRTNALTAYWGRRYGSGA